MRIIDADRIPYDMVMQNPFDEQSEKIEVIKKSKIERMPTIQAIPLDRIKQAREEIDDLYRYYDTGYYSGNRDSMFKCSEVFKILDNLIAESET